MAQLDNILVHPPPELNRQRSQHCGYSSRPSSRLPLLVRLARRLRDNEAVLTLMVNTFRTLQRLGINVTPNHYYWPIPDIETLGKRAWADCSDAAGCHLHLDEQIGLLHVIGARYAPEWRFAHVSNGRGAYHYNNGFFESVDAEVAYSFVRLHKPRRIIEIGGGYSTRVLATALRANWERDDCGGELISIDPSPSRVPHDPLVQVIAQPVQEVGLELFLSLQDGDILFLDSSHIVGVGSDVVREYLEILPRLNRGVIVHLHDIFLPSDYPREAVLRNLCFWSEQYLLQAFLAFNSHFKVLWASSAMQAFHPEELEAAFPQWRESYKSMPHELRRFIPSRDGERVWPSSFWIRRVKGEDITEARASWRG